MKGTAARIRRELDERGKWDRDAGDTQYQFLYDEVEAVRLELKESIDKQEKEDAARGCEKWKEWVLHRVKKGARNAHKYLRGGSLWTPTVSDGLLNEGDTT